MPRRKNGNRAQYDPVAEGLEAVKGLSVDQLHDKKQVWAALAAAKVDVAARTMGTIRSRALQIAGESNGQGKLTVAGGDLMSHLETVMTTIRKVGGIDNMKRIVSVVERIKKAEV